MTRFPVQVHLEYSSDTGAASLVWTMSAADGVGDIEVDRRAVPAAEAEAARRADAELEATSARDATDATAAAAADEKADQ